MRPGLLSETGLRFKRLKRLLGLQHRWSLQGRVQLGRATGEKPRDRVEISVNLCAALEAG
jgi:hypothetical protein